MEMNVMYLCVIFAVFLVVCHGLIEDCPSRYTIKTQSSYDLTVKTRILKQKICDKRFLDKPSASTTARDIKPTVLVPYLKHGQYFLNITWRTKADNNNYLPRKYIVRFVYSVPERNISHRTECLQLQILDRPSWRNERSLTLYLDCVKVLSETKDGDFSMQIWQKQPGKCGRTRSIRSTLPCDKVQRSEKLRYSMALDHYKHEICSCHFTEDTRVNMSNITILKDDYIGFEVTLSDLPDFLQRVKVSIRTNNVDVFNRTFVGSNISRGIHNNSIKFVTGPLAKVAGTYYLTFRYECVSSGIHHNSLDDGCYPHDLHNSTLTKVSARRTDPVSSDVSTIAIIACAVALSVAVTCIVFVFRKLRLSFNSKEQLTEQNNFIQLRPQREPAIDEHAELLQMDCTDISVTVLSHPPDMEPVFTDILHSIKTKQFTVQTGRHVNWMHFASQVVKSAQIGETCNIIVFVSKGLIELLFGDEEDRLRRQEERQYEDVPTLVLDGLKNLDNTTRQNIILHVISINTNKGRELSEKFVEEHHNLTVFEYFFHNSSLDLDDNAKELCRLTSNIRKQL